MVTAIVLAGCDNIATSDATNTYPYICPQGTPQSGASETPNTEQCTKCGAGFRLSDSNTCELTQYVCTNGTARNGTPGGVINVPHCTDCNTGYFLTDVNTCVTSGTYTCTNGTKKTGYTNIANNEEYCTDCDTGYKLNTTDNTCTVCDIGYYETDSGTCATAGSYTCTNGTKKTGFTNNANNEEYCTDCNNRYYLTDTNTCAVAGVYTCTNGYVKTGHPNGSDDVEFCTSCTGNYKLTSNNDCNDCQAGYYLTDSNACAIAGTFTCTNGEQKTGFTDSAANEEYCINCDTGYKLNTADNTCSLCSYGYYQTDSGTCAEIGVRNNSKEFNLRYNAGNNTPRGIWSDGTTMWVVDGFDDTLYAYTLSSGARDTTKEFNLASDNRSPDGIWSDGTTMWVADSFDSKLYAYTLSSGARDTTKEFNLASDNRSPDEIWSDGTTIWIWVGYNILHAYTLSSGARNTAKEFMPSDSSGSDGIWSDGTTMWVVGRVVDTYSYKLYAYTVNVITE